MGTALLKGWLRDEDSRKNFSFSACVRTQASLERLRSTFNQQQNQHITLNRGDSAATAMATTADIIILGCAPTEYDNLLQIPNMPEILQSRLVISLLAGVTYERLTAGLHAHGAKQANPRFARIMPTLGAQNGDSVSLLATTTNDDTPEYFAPITQLFRRLGTVTAVPEHLFAEATALEATCHALTIVAAETLADAGAAGGLPRELAAGIVARCWRSSGGLLKAGMSTAGMKEAMAIPGGITVNTVLKLEREARPAVAEGLAYAVERARGM